MAQVQDCLSNNVPERDGPFSNSKPDGLSPPVTSVTSTDFDETTRDAVLKLGPLGSGDTNNCEYRKPRVSSHCQAIIPELSEPKVVKQHATRTSKKQRGRLQAKSDTTEGTALWIPGKIPEKLVEHYLQFVKSLFGGSEEDYSEERALFFLHRNEYDVFRAKELLCMKERKKAEEKDSSESESEVYDEEDFCFVCNDGGSLLLCDALGCKKVFHLHCARLDEVPEGSWECPTHFCLKCNGPSDPNARCSYCPTAYCKKHLPADLVSQKDTTCEFLCEECMTQNISTRNRFLCRLHDLLKRRGERIPKVPRLAGQELDLFGLYTGVVKLGGVKRVIEGMYWSRIRDQLQIPTSCTNASSQLKNTYMNTLYHYEQLYFADSQAVINIAGKRGRPKGSTSKKSRVSKSSGIYDVVIIKELDDAYQLEMNVDGVIKHGFMFKPIGSAPVVVQSSSSPSKLSSEDAKQLFSDDAESSAGKKRQKRRFFPIFPQRPIPFGGLVVDLRLCMKFIGMTQTSLGQVIGVTQEMISSFFLGKTVAQHHQLPAKLRAWIDSQPAEVRTFIENEREKHGASPSQSSTEIAAEVANGISGGDADSDNTDVEDDPSDAESGVRMDGKQEEESIEPLAKRRKVET
eukprot:220715_1